MRKAVGIIVLIAGGGALAWWAESRSAAAIEDAVSAAAREAITGFTHSITAEVSGRDIVVSGLANDAAEEARIIAAAEAVEGRRAVSSALKLLPVAAPFEVRGSFDGSALMLDGVVPSEIARDVLRVDLGDAVVPLTLASGAPESWEQALATAAQAAMLLKNATFTLSDQTLTLSGLAATPKEASAVEEALAALPDGYAVETAIENEDDGRPFSLSVERPLDAPVTATGKLPVTMDSALLSSLPGTVRTDGLAIARITSQDGLWPNAARAGVAALAALEDGSLTMTDRAGKLAGRGTRAGIAAAEEALTVLPEGYTIDTELTVFDDGMPISLLAEKSGATLALSGKLPFGATAEALQLPSLPDAVAVAEIDATSPAFLSGSTTALIQLGTLANGTLQVTDAQSPDGPARLTLTGEGTRRQIALALDALEMLPAGYEVETDLSPLDDGLPLGLRAEKAGETVTMVGKMPFGTEPSQLGLDAFEEAVIVSEVDAKSPDFIAVAQAGLIGLAALEDGMLTVADAEEPGAPARLRIEGGVTRAGLDALNMALGELPAGVAPAIDVVFADDGTPIRLSAIFDGSALNVSGKLPFGSALETLELANLAEWNEPLTVAEIEARDDDFLTKLSGALAALTALENGALEVTDAPDPDGDTRIVLTGTARMPSDRDAALSLLKGGELETRIALIDDGTPPDFTFTFDASTGASLDGKLPEGMAPRSVAQALGLTIMRSSDAQAGLTGTAGDYDALFAALRAWLPALDALTARFDGDGLAELTALPSPDANTALVAQSLRTEFSVTVNLADSTELTAGQERVNALSGRAERFSGTAWLPVLTFMPELGRCASESRALLTRARIGFIAGSAQLGPRATRALNELAAIIRHCRASAPELAVEIRGHTDAQGDAAANLALSEARAEAVLTALVARGVDAGALTARGFGEDAPIADNGTAEGRLLNRRTEFTWSAATDDQTTEDE